MTTQFFDHFGQPELPYIILKNPNLEELYSLGLAYDATVAPRFNALGDFKFSFPQSIDGGQTIIEAYNYIKNKRVVEIQGFGNFQIIDAEENTDGATPIKIVTCQSLEGELINKRLVAYTGTKKFYDSISPTGTLLQDMLDLAPTWSVGNVDADLQVMFRTFNISDSNVYNFLMNDVETAFQCVFIFDTINKTISAKTLANATTNTDIFLSFDNLIEKATLTEKSDEICTCLAVSGGGNLSINQVNPLGTNKIYNFSYFKNTTWMSQSLVNAITAWENLVTASQITYSNNLVLLETYNSDLLALQAILTQYQSDLITLQNIQAVRITEGLSYSDINTQITDKQAQITNQQTLINNKNLQIANILSVLTAINSSVSFANNFTPSQLLELNEFIYENTYQNSNIIQTDTMTLPEVQQAAQSLYNQAIDVLSRVSQTRYEIKIDSVNYLALQEFQVFTQQTELGCVVTARLDDQDGYISAVLLEISINLNDPSNFTMTFSNRLRMDGSNFIYSDLMGSVQKTGSSVSFNSSQWSNWEVNYKNDVTTFINSSLNTANNNLINNTNQEILINQTGLRGRTFDPSTGTYKNTQVWLTSNTLAFSNDAFQTAKLALGEITAPNGSKTFGLVADTIVGRMIAGNQLTISNDNSNFILDATGAYLNNAKFTLSTINTKIIIDPTATNSFVIQKNEGGTFNNKFWVDNTGNVNFSGNLSGATGTFSGNLSAATGTFVGDISGASGTFSGTVQADKLLGSVSYTQLTDIPANKITSSTMSGDRILGGTASVSTLNSPQINLGSSSAIYVSGGNLEIISNGSTSISSAGGGGGAVSASSSGVNISGGSMYIYSSGIYIGGGYGGWGRTTAIYLSNYGKYMYFSNGILTGW